MADTPGNDIEELFAEALRRPPGERTAFLAEACESEVVRAEVTALLAAYEDGEEFLEAIREAAVPPLIGELQAREEDRPPAASSDPLELEGQVVGRYAIEEYLGGGGMGVVYRARDTELGRTVALKFLPQHLTSSEEAQERFVREARAAAGLDHPNIATIHETAATEEGRRFIAMGYYAGETLKEKLARDRRLPVEKAVGYGIQLAEGLAAAHAAGIVHRDVKPANVIVTEAGRVKIVDFGLAQVATETRLTEPGRRLGTAAYMSPEQARGEAVSPESDLWALGAVLYEMLTGRRPFGGNRPSATVHAILHEDPPSLQELRPEVPEALVRLVEGLLQKSLVDRYGSAEAVLEDLQAVFDGGSPAIESPAGDSYFAFRLENPSRRWRMGVAIVLAVLSTLLGWGLWPERTVPDDELPDGSSSSASVAVLPFEVSGSGAEDWRDGMVTVLTTGLDGAAGLRAIADRTVFAAWEQGDSLRVKAESNRALETARQVGARYAVDGSAVTLGGELRLSADIYETETGERLGKARAAGPADNVMALADQLTREVLEVLLNKTEEALPSVDLASLTTESLTALKAYLEGDRHFRDGEYEAAVEDYERAVEFDSTFALAYARLGRSYRWLVEVAKGEKLFEKAYEMSDRLPDRERRLVEAQHSWLVEDRAGAAADSLRQLIQTYPDDPRVWYVFGEVLFHGDIPRGWPEAEQVFRRAIELDPGLAPYHHHFVDLAFALHHDSTLAAKRIAAHPASRHKQLYRLTLDLVFGKAPQQRAALRQLENVPIPGAHLPTSYALRHPSDGNLRDMVFRVLQSREDFDNESFARRLAGSSFQRGQIDEGLTHLQKTHQNSTFRSCLLARSMSLGMPVSDSILRPALEPSQLGSDASTERLTCAGIYLIEQGREEQLRQVISRIREAENRPGVSEEKVQAQIAELKGYRARKAGDLERAATLWSAANSFDRSETIWRGDLYRALGDRRKAEGWYQAAWYHPVAHERLGKLYEQMDKPEEAAAAYERFIEAWTGADEPLQDRVRRARERLGKLTASENDHPGAGRQ